MVGRHASRLARSRGAGRDGDHRGASAGARVAYARAMETEARMEFETVVGLKVHTQLLTESKVFRGCSA